MAGLRRAPSDATIAFWRLLQHKFKVRADYRTRRTVEKSAAGAARPGNWRVIGPATGRLTITHNILSSIS